MAITYGFFNGVLGDRKYNANHYSDMFSGIMTDGVFSTVADKFAVKVVTGMTVKVQSGRAYFNGTWLKNDADYLMTVSAPHATLPRIDTLVLDFDKTTAVRANSIKLLKGTAASVPVSPGLINTVEHKQYRLANIAVRAATSSITTGDITVRVGTSDCPWATGLLQQATVDNLLAQWDYQFHEWFDNLEDLLDANAETNLLNKILEIYQRPVAGRNLIINGGMSSRQRSDAPGPIYSGGFVGGPDLWRLNQYSAGACGVYRTNLNDHTGLNRSWYQVQISTGTNANPVSDAMMSISHVIEAGRIQNALKGSPGAKKMFLSFTIRSNLAGIYNVEIVDVGSNRHFGASINNTIVNTPKRFTIEIPADTSGEIYNTYNAGLRVKVWLGAGSMYSSGTHPATWGTVVNANSAPGQVFLSRTTGNFFALSDVQLEVSPQVSPFENLPEEETLSLCRRYLEIESVNTFFLGLNSSQVRSMPVSYRTPKRAIPTVIFNTSAIFNPNALIMSGVILQSALNGKDMIDVIASVGPVAANAVYRGYLTYIASSELA